MKNSVRHLCFISLIFFAPEQALAQPISDTVSSKTVHTQSNDAIKKKMIEDSINAYPGRCPCPYNTTRNGSSCGRRSAYSRPGGYAPLCYQKDITEDMIKHYRENHS
ncbi:MAG: hypothetical protein V4525_08190 [Pseudomonadota bacterium]